jgi:hypothetical protein
MPDDFETIALCVTVIGGDDLRAFLYLIRNSFFVPKVEQTFWFAGFHRFNYSLGHRGW